MYDKKHLRLAVFVTGTAVLLLSGCAQTPHNNVLVFGTTTKFGIDITTDAAQGQRPDLTIGYKRREAVWLPLAKNQYADCSSSKGGSNCKITTGINYQGRAKGIDSNLGGEDREIDTYSVFASFGAKFGGSGDKDGATASGGLAQFFATGIAAQRLGANQGVSDALAINPASAADLRNAQEELSKKNMEIANLRLENELGADKVAAIRVEQRKTTNKKSDAVIACAKPGDPTGKAGEIVDRAIAETTNQSAKTILPGLKTEPDLVWRREMNDDKEILRSLHVAATAICP